jgi:natural product precursor
MKSLTLFKNNEISNQNMNALKGGTGSTIPTSVTIDTMVEITTTNAVGTTEMLYCDRRRKKVNC